MLVSCCGSLAALWSPGAINIYLIVQATGLSWSKVFIPGVIMAVLGMGLSTLMEMGVKGEGPSPSDDQASRQAPADPAVPDRSSAPESAASVAAPALGSADASCGASNIRSADGRRVFHVLLVALIFIVAVAILDRTGVGTAAGRSVIAGAAIALGWIFTLRRKPGIGASFREYWEIGTSKVADIAPFFVAMGVFSTGIEESGFLAIAGPILQTMAGHLGGASVILIALLIIAMSLVGLHPFITIVLFGKILAHAAIPLPQITIALAITSGSLTAYMLTPFAGVIMAIARSLEVRAVDVALKWNWRFCALFFAMTIGFAFAWGAFFG